MRPFTVLTALVLALVAGGDSHAGPYADDLSKCLVEKTNTEDRNSLVRWMFVAASHHPAVRSIATVTDHDVDDANEKTGQLFMRLLTDSCKDASHKALKYEGLETLQTSFSVLGQVAAKELFASPEVATAISGLEEYVDPDKLTAMIEGK